VPTKEKNGQNDHFEFRPVSPVFEFPRMRLIGNSRPFSRSRPVRTALEDWARYPLPRVMKRAFQDLTALRPVEGFALHESMSHGLYLRVAYPY